MAFASISWSSCPDFLQWWIVTWKCKPYKSFFPWVAFSHSNRKEIKTLSLFYSLRFPIIYTFRRLKSNYYHWWHFHFLKNVFFPVYVILNGSPDQAQSHQCIFCSVSSATNPTQWIFYLGSCNFHRRTSIFPIISSTSPLGFLNLWNSIIMTLMYLAAKANVHGHSCYISKHWFLSSL